MIDAAAPAPSYNLHRFELTDMIELGAAVRKLHPDSGSMEEAAAGIVQYLYEHLRDPATEERNCALVRFFKTHRFADLEPPLQDFARHAAGNSPDLNDETRCLTLLATAGARPEWNRRDASAGHKAIPLVTEEVVRQAPMVAQLIQQIGVDIAQIIRPDNGIMLDLDRQNYNVFHVPEAEGSPFVPAQDFVRENRIKSVLGFGGIFPSAELFAVIIFSRVYIPRETAEMFRTVALGLKLSLLPWVRGQVFSKVA
ncbi:MAG TPA: hypothetical protein VIY53_10690 [Acidobacteriaceae bacterium]